MPEQDQAAGTPKKKRKTFAPDELVGQEVGGYKVKEKIGQGGMGSVYMAEQLSLTARSRSRSSTRS